MSPPTGRLDRQAVVTHAARRRSTAPTRSTSCSGPPKPSTRSAARPGTTPGAPARQRRAGRGHRIAAGTAASSSTPATRCGRTPTTSPPTSSPSWPGSPRPTPACTAPTSSKKASVTCSASKARTARRPSTGGCRGPAHAASRLRQARPADRHHRAEIEATLDHGLSNALIESTNTKIRLITRIAFGFTQPRRPHRPRHALPRRLPPATTGADDHERPTDASGEPLLSS